ncbi:MAG: hypothetical protein DMF62_03265 [Acidobacteria bacterium]|nr:MAG: hypothetical protein DMF62_03265 [Acidobacteriota bacterium]
MTPTLDAAQLCGLTGMIDATHRKLADQGWFPKPVKGQYQAVATIKGIIRYLRQRTDDPLKKRNAELKNEMIAHSLGVKRAEYVKATEVKRELTRAIVALKTRIMGIPDAQAPRLALTTDAREVKEILRTELIAALTELSKTPLMEAEEPQPANNGHELELPKPRKAPRIEHLV